MRPSLEQLYMEFAQMLSHRSTCRRLQVGTVITTSDLEAVIAIGYNGGAKGELPLDKCRDNEPGNCGCIHSEQNALSKTLIKTRDKFFFTTISPCIICAKMIINSGAAHVFIKTKYRDETGLQLLRQADLNVSFMTEASQAV